MDLVCAAVGNPCDNNELSPATPETISSIPDLAAGDVLYIENGTYNLTGTLTFSASGTSANKITVYGAGTGKTIINGNGAVTAVVVSGAHYNMHHIEMNNADAVSLNVSNGNNKFSYCLFQQTSLVNNIGAHTVTMLADASDNNEFFYCNFYNGRNGHGLLIQPSAGSILNPKITYCKFDCGDGPYTGATGPVGLYLHTTNGAVVSNNRLHNWFSGIAIYTGNSNATVSNNYISNNNTGLPCGIHLQTGIQTNINILHNSISFEEGWLLHFVSENTNTGSTVRGNILNCYSSASLSNCIYKENGTSKFAHIDCNDFYYTGGDIVCDGANGCSPTLGDLQLYDHDARVGFNGNENSLDIDPNFNIVASSITDIFAADSLALDLKRNSGLIGQLSGTCSGIVTNDIYNVTRPANATIGAQEILCPNKLVQYAPTNTTTTANMYCEDKGWTYYYNSAAPNNYLFAIEHKPVGAGANTNNFTASVDIMVNANSTTTSGVNYNASGSSCFGAMGRSWNVNVVSGSLNGYVNIRFFFQAAEYTALNTQMASCSFTPADNVKWFKTIGANYNQTSNTADGVLPSVQVLTPNFTGTDNNALHNNKNYVQFDKQITSFSGGTAGQIKGTGSPLPVSFTDINAVAVGKSIHVNWETAVENNCDKYEVERSKDGVNFEKIGVVKGSNNNYSLKNYKFIDNNPLNGTNFYRLIQWDFNGDNVKSKIVNAKVYQSGIVINSFNTVGELTNVNCTSASNISSEVKMFDIKGNLLLSKKIELTEGVNHFEINTKNFSKGIYFINIQNEQGTATAKLNL